MTIHRALAELKLIDARIEKAIKSIEPMGLMKEGGLVNNVATKEDFEKNAKAQYQSATDLMSRKIIIKAAIAADKELVSMLSKKYKEAMASFMTQNEKINNIALENAKIMIGKQGDDKVKPTDEDVKNIVEPFVKRNQLHLVDPLQTKELVQKIQEQIDGFETEVDAILSESNAITTISI